MKKKQRIGKSPKGAIILKQRARMAEATLRHNKLYSTIPPSLLPQVTDLFKDFFAGKVSDEEIAEKVNKDLQHFLNNDEVLVQLEAKYKTQAHGRLLDLLRSGPTQLEAFHKEFPLTSSMFTEGDQEMLKVIAERLFGPNYTNEKRLSNEFDRELVVSVNPTDCFSRSGSSPMSNTFDQIVNGTDKSHKPDD